MKNRLLFFLTLFSFKLLVNGEFEVTSQDKNGTVAIDLCSLQKETGTCNEEIKRYFYIPRHKGCGYFTYRGCKRNHNNFLTTEQCKENCPGKFIETRQPVHCFLEPEIGLCDDHIPSFYYDWMTNNCVKFIYSGCYGNNNRFTSMDKCINDCRSYEFSLQFNVQ